MERIDRREAIRRSSLILGSAISSSLMLGNQETFAAETGPDWTPLILDSGQVKLVDELTERILPATGTPGAREAKVVRFIDRMVAEYLRDPEREVLFTGLQSLKNEKFLEQEPTRQNSLIVALAKQGSIEPSPDSKPFFFLMKEMTLLGFFNSEVGATQVLNYDPIPGGYQGCLSLEEAGGKAWAS